MLEIFFYCAQQRVTTVGSLKQAHIIFYEIPIWISKHNKPLGTVTAQKFETVHTG